MVAIICGSEKRLENRDIVEYLTMESDRRIPRYFTCRNKRNEPRARVVVPCADTEGRLTPPPPPPRGSKLKQIAAWEADGVYTVT